MVLLPFFCCCIAWLGIRVHASDACGSTRDGSCVILEEAVTKADVALQQNSQKVRLEDEALDGECETLTEQSCANSPSCEWDSQHTLCRVRKASLLQHLTDQCETLTEQSCSNSQNCEWDSQHTICRVRKDASLLQLLNDDCATLTGQSCPNSPSCEWDSQHQLCRVRKDASLLQLADEECETLTAQTCPNFPNCEWDSQHQMCRARKGASLLQFDEDDECDDWGCTCQGLSNRYGADGNTDGDAPQKARDWWVRHTCATTPQAAAAPPSSGGEQVGDEDEVPEAESLLERLADECEALTGQSCPNSPTCEWDSQHQVCRVRKGALLIQRSPTAKEEQAESLLERMANDCETLTAQSCPNNQNCEWDSQHQLCRVSKAVSLLQFDEDNECDDWGCTCQGLSDLFGTGGNSDGSAPPKAREWWVRHACATTPAQLIQRSSKKVRNDCEPLTGQSCPNNPSCEWDSQHQLCRVRKGASLLQLHNDEECDDWGCTCQGLSDLFGTDGNSDGSAPQKAREWWLRHACATNPQAAAGASSSTGEEHIGDEDE